MPGALPQEFVNRLPIVRFPSRSQDLRFAVRKARLVKYDLGPRALLHQLEPRNRIDARSPAAGSPGLHDSLPQHKFDLCPVMYPPKSVKATPTSRLFSTGFSPRCIDCTTPLSCMTLSNCLESVSASSASFRFALKTGSW